MEICKRLKNLLAGEESLSENKFLHVAFMCKLQLKREKLAYVVVQSDWCNFVGGRVLRVQPQYAYAKCLHAWLGLEGISMSHSQGEQEKHATDVEWNKIAELSLQTFDQVLARGSNIDALLGRAYFYELKQDYAKALGELNQVIIMRSLY
jgi:hypothetical protein